MPNDKLDRTEGGKGDAGASAASHTPGPWAYCGHPQPCECGYIFGDGGEVYIAKTLTLADEIDPVASKPQRVANARLIAAAPELLEALKAVVDSAVPNPRDHPTMFPAWDLAKRAIAKVEGR